MLRTLIPPPLETTARKNELKLQIMKTSAKKMNEMHIIEIFLSLMQITQNRLIIPKILLFYDII